MISAPARTAATAAVTTLAKGERTASSENGLIDVHDYLASHGVNLPEGYRINSVTDISNPFKTRDLE